MKNILTFILLSICLLASAQSRLEKRVYYLDCSQTMLKNDLWNRVKNNLKDAINKIEDSSTEIEVVLFAYDLSHNTGCKIDHECKQLSTPDGKKKLIAFIDNISTPTRGKETTYTFHDVPLIDFCTYRINDNRDTYFYLMTDGFDEYGKKGPQVSTQNFDNYINSKWNQITKNKNIFGFYVMLAGKDEKRMKLCENTSYLWYMETADVNVNTIRASVENNTIFPSPIKIRIVGKKNLKYVDPIISTNSRYYDISKKYENGLITLIPSIKTGVRPKDIPESENIKVSLSTNQGPFDNGKQFNIIVDEELYTEIRCSKNLIALKANNSYNVRKDNSFELIPTKGDLSKAESIDVWFEDSLHLYAHTQIEGNKLFVYPKLREGIDSTYYINKFTNDSVQNYTLFYSVKSNDPFTYMDASNSSVVKFEGKWEKWLTTSINSDSKSESLFSWISSWFISDKTSSLGTVTYYPSFLWEKDSTSNSKAKWSFIFTRDALGIADTKVKFEFCDKAGCPLDTAQYRIYVDNRLLDGNMFEVTNKMNQVNIEVWMKPGISTHLWWGTDEFEGNLKVIAFNNIYGINDSTINKGSLVLPWTIVYEKEWNPLVIKLIIILTLLLLSVVLFFLYLYLKAVFAPKFSSNHQIEFSPNDKFDVKEEHNFELLDKNPEPIMCIQYGNSIFSFKLANKFARLQVVPEDTACITQPWLDKKLHGMIYCIHCRFYHKDIKKIEFIPQKGNKILCKLNNCVIGELQVNNDGFDDSNKIDLGKSHIFVHCRRKPVHNNNE